MWLVDSRLFVNGVLWVLSSGSHWTHLPRRYGKRKMAHNRSRRSAAAGVWRRYSPTRSETATTST